MTPKLRDDSCTATSGVLAKSLSPNLRHLFDRMWHLGFGTIRGLNIRAGDPLLDPPPLVIRTIRLADAGPPNQASAVSDFALKREQIAFQRQLAAIDAGVIDVIKVHDGLPVSFELHESL